MILIHGSLIVFVTTDTGESRIIARYIMTGGAIVVPFVFVFARIDREMLTVMIEC